LFTGGDRGLVDEVLADRRLAPLDALRREPALDVGDPTKAVLLDTPKQFRAVDVHIVEPGEGLPVPKVP
jgi:VLRF1 release factor-like protein